MVPHGDYPSELQLLDEWQQPEFKQGWKQIGMPILVLLKDASLEYQSAMKAWNRDVVPAEASGGASFESWDIVFEVGDDHLHNLRRETARVRGVFGMLV